MAVVEHLHNCRQWAKGSFSTLQSYPLVQHITQNPRETSYAVLVVGIFIIVGVRAVRFFKTPKDVRARSPDLEKPVGNAGNPLKDPDRKAGAWTPIDFQRPKATPLHDWDVYKTESKPYRPFRYGPYHVTMGLRRMEWDDWIELDNEYLKFHADKASRMQERGAKCSQTAPRAYPAALELLQELCAYLPERYPTLFVSTPTGMRNLVTGEDFDITATPLAEDPMQMAGRMVQDDLAIMMEREDGQYYLEAGSILLAGFWRLQDKVGMCLDEIHTSGDVPRYKERLGKGMNNFFKRVLPDGPVQRNNYFIQADSSLPWSHTIGPEDSPPGTLGWITASTSTPASLAQHHFRSERQSLRRLPKSGGVVFTIRTYFVPVSKLCEEPGVPARLASAIRSWGDDVARYKGRERYQEALLAWLDQVAERHRDEGLVGRDEEEKESAYPF